MADSEEEWRIERFQWCCLSGSKHNQKYSFISREVLREVPLIAGQSIDGLEILERGNPIHWR